MEEIYILKQRNEHLEEKLQKRGNLPIEVMAGQQGEEAVLLALSREQHQSFKELINYAQKFLKSSKRYEMLFKVTSILFAMITLASFLSHYQSYMDGTCKGAECDKFQKWYNQFDGLVAIEGKITNINDRLKTYKIQQSTCERNFKRLIGKIKRDHNQLKLDWKAIEATKYNFKLGKVEWLSKFIEVMSKTSSKAMARSLNHYYFRDDMDILVRSQNKLNDNLSILMESFNEARRSLRESYDKLTSTEFDSSLLRIVFKKLNDGLENFRLDVMPFHKDLFYADYLKYDVVKAGTEHARALHDFDWKFDKLMSRLHTCTLDNLFTEPKACYPKSSSVQDYVFMLHGYGNNYGCKIRETKPDLFINPWDYHFHENRVFAIYFTPGLDI